MQSSPGNIYMQLIFSFFFSTKRIGIISLSIIWLLCLCITTLHGILLHYCIPLNLLECIMQICDSSLCISKRDLRNARAAAELPMVRAVEHCHSSPLESRVWRTQGLGSWPTLSNAKQLRCAASDGLNSSCWWPKEGMLSKMGNVKENIVIHVGGVVCEWGEWNNAWCLQIRVLFVMLHLSWGAWFWVCVSVTARDVRAGCFYKPQAHLILGEHGSWLSHELWHVTYYRVSPLPHFRCCCVCQIFQ